MMSSRPKCSCARFTAAKSASRSVTSSAIGKIASPYVATRSSCQARFRAVAATLSPRSRAAIAHSRPKPRDVPVMNQVFMGAPSRDVPLRVVTSTRLRVRVRSNANRGVPSGGYDVDEAVEDLEHVGAGLGGVDRFGDVEGGLVAGAPEDVRERPDRLRTDAPGLDALLEHGLRQPEDVPLAHFAPVRPADDRRPVDEGDAVNLGLNADVEPGPQHVPHRVDRVGD